VPLTATALLPFLVLPLGGVMTAGETASSYYSPTMFLILGGAFLALAIERTGLHGRLALGILNRVGKGGGGTQLLIAFMLATGLLSTLISNTSTALIMMPMALAVLAGGGLRADDKEGLSGALPMGIAFAASIGGLGTIIGSPTNAIAVGLLDETIGVRIGFAQWMAFGMPIVLIGVPLAALIIAKVQKVGRYPFDIETARTAIATQREWTLPERRLIPLVALALLLWVTRPLTDPFLPAGAREDGLIAVGIGLLLFIVPDGTGRPLLTWPVVALVVLITEFASNVATASGIMPVVASLTVALGADPLLLALPAAMAASWGFMLPAGTGPNAIAWATGRIALPRMLWAGLLLDIAGVFLIVGAIWAVAAVV
jgi:sodium-dependent dicarboxylate transporter 2/3/5